MSFSKLLAKLPLIFRLPFQTRDYFKKGVVPKQGRVKGMPVAGMCPYFRYEKAGVTYCECGELRFPDRRARRDIVYAYCAHPNDFRQCPFKKALDGYYERSL